MDQLEYVIHMLRSAGLSVELINKGDRTGVRKRELLVNGMHCGVHILKNISKQPGRQKRLYVHGLAHRNRVAHLDFLAILMDVRGYRRSLLFVPTGAFLEAYGRDESTHAIAFNVPVQRPLPEDCRQRLHWWDYQNAFHLASRSVS